jgi:hypothetical protein
LRVHGVDRLNRVFAFGINGLGNLSHRLGRGFTDEWVKDTNLGLKLFLEYDLIYVTSIN